MTAILNTVETKKAEAKIIPLPLLLTDSEYDDLLYLYTDGIWKLSHFFFWPKVKFSEAEINQYKNLISESILKYKNIKAGFKILLEKTVTLALDEALQKEISRTLPVGWFQIHNTNGLNSQRVFLHVRERYDPAPFSDTRLLKESLCDYLCHRRRRTLDIISERLLAFDRSHLLQILFDFIIHCEHSKKWKN